MVGRIAVTGGAGFFAAHLLERLRKALPAAELVAVDVASTPPDRRQPGVEYLDGLGVCDERALATALRGADTVVNCAGFVSFSLRETARLYETNSALAAAVARACARTHVRRLVHVSSVAALGYRGDPNVPVDEGFRFDWDVARRLAKHYMLSKREGDLLLDAFGGAFELAVVHPGLMLGPGDRTNTPGLVRAASGPVCVAPPGGTNVVDVRDVADGVVALVRGDHVSGRFILGGENFRCSELLRRIRAVLGRAGPVVVLPNAVRRPLHGLARLVEALSPRPAALTADNADSMFEWRFFSSALAERTFGYRPGIPIEDTIRDYLRALRTSAQAAEDEGTRERRAAHLPQTGPADAFPGGLSAVDPAFGAAAAGGVAHRDARAR